MFSPLVARTFAPSPRAPRALSFALLFSLLIGSSSVFALSESSGESSGESTGVRVGGSIHRGPSKSGKAVRMDVSPHLLEMASQVTHRATEDEASRGPHREVLNKFAPAPLLDRQNVPYDTTARRVQTVLPERDPSRAPGGVIGFEGYSNLDNASFGSPTNPADNNADVGLDYIVEFANVGFVIIEKDAPHTKYGPFVGNSLWQGFGGPCELQNAGDPIVLFDHLAQRWVYSQFTGSTVPRQCFAVSQGSSPFGPFVRYEFNYSEGNTVFNDYGKIGVWTDPSGKRSGYYMTSNDFVNDQFRNMSFLVFERDQMLAGATQNNVGFVQWQWFPSAAVNFFGAQPPNLEGTQLPPNNGCGFFVQQWDDEIFTTNPNPAADGYVFWEVCVNWSTNSFFSSDPYRVSVGIEWDSGFCVQGGCMPQPGTTQGLDTLSQFTMNRFNIRAVTPTRGPDRGVTSYKALVTHTSNAGGNRAGVHWSQLDLTAALSSPGSPGGDPGPLPSVLQSSTYAPGNVHRAFGTGSHDREGNFAISYTATSSSLFPSVRFTGQQVGATPNQLESEATCAQGGGSQTGTSRWQDYASMSIDPEDQCTFWSTHMYQASTNQGLWNTAICAVRFPSCQGGSDEIFSDGFESGNTNAW